MFSNDDRSFYWRIARRTVRACWMVLWDLLGAIAILAALKILDIVQEWLWSDRVPTYLGVISVSFIVDTVDITVLIVFAVFGLYDVYRELRREADVD